MDVALKYTGDVDAYRPKGLDGELVLIEMPQIVPGSVNDVAACECRKPAHGPVNIYMVSNVYA